SSIFATHTLCLVPGAARNSKAVGGRRPIPLRTKGGGKRSVPAASQQKRRTKAVAQIAIKQATTAMIAISCASRRPGQSSDDEWASPCSVVVRCSSRGIDPSSRGRGRLRVQVLPASPRQQSNGDSVSERLSCPGHRRTGGP